MASTTQATELKSIERLAEKIKDLIGLLKRTRAELLRTTADNQRLQQEIEHLTKRLENAESSGKEMTDLLAERDQIHARVQKILEQLEAIS